MMEQISNDLERLASDAGEMSGRLLEQAVRQIDDQFGKGYSKCHPELIGKLIEASVSQWNTVVFAKLFHESTDRLANSILQLSPEQ